VLTTAVISIDDAVSPARLCLPSMNGQHAEDLFWMNIVSSRWPVPPHCDDYSLSAQLSAQLLTPPRRFVALQRSASLSA
jgi:hypothetical protein